MGQSRIPVGVSVGDVLAEKYRVEEVIGVGGMGVVVGARHVQLDTHVALKFMLEEHLDDDEAVSRFLREAKAAAKLRGEHVARVTDVGKLTTGAPYMVMEYLEGSDLGELTNKGPAPTIKEACLYVFQACDALDEAHAAGIVHRDVKPSNLFLTRTPKGEPCVKVLDFGISKIASSGGPSANLQVTKTAAVFGSPLYMSPEQMRSSRDVDARADIWSLGATLYELLTGSVPFVGETVIDLCMRVTQDPVAPPSSITPSIPKELDAIVVRCLEKDPKARFPNARELAIALAPFADERAPSLPQAIVTVARDSKSADAVIAGAATDPSWGKTTPPKKAKSRAVYIGAGAAAIAGALAISLVATHHSTASDAPQPVTTQTTTAPTETMTAAATTTPMTATTTATPAATPMATETAAVASASTTAPTKPKPASTKPASTPKPPASSADPYSNPN